MIARLFGTPRLVVRTSVAMFSVVTVVLTAVLLLIAVQGSRYVRSTVGHERPDGGGYPHGLTAEETPLLARMIHVADACDALTSARAYRPTLDFADAIGELWRCAGTQFEAEVVQGLVQALAVAGPGDDSDAAGSRSRHVRCLASSGAGRGEGLT